MTVGALGLPLAVDPGEHQLELSAPGKRPKSRHFALSAPQAERDSQIVRVDLGPLVSLNAEPLSKEPMSPRVDSSSTVEVQQEANGWSLTERRENR